LTIVVTNDDGFGAEGIDALVRGLEKLPDVEVEVVAPATDRTATGGQSTEGDIGYEDAETRSGHPAVAVDGFPADTITVALDELDLEPDLVMSGINAGQNLGPVVDVSGTVGAARAAARRGIPALAISQGIGDGFDYPQGVDYALDWLADHRDEIRADGDDGDDGPAVVTSLNVPSCSTGEARGVVEVPPADAGTPEAVVPQDCTVTGPAPDSDVAGFNDGYATLSTLPLEPAD
jgi:5'-nucleotidase